MGRPKKMLVQYVAKLTYQQTIDEFTKFLIDSSVGGLKHRRSDGKGILYKWTFVVSDIVVDILLMQKHVGQWVVQYRGLTRHHFNNLGEIEHFVTKALRSGLPAQKRSPSENYAPDYMNPRAKELWRDTCVLYRHEWLKSADVEQQWAYAINKFKELCNNKGVEPFLRTWKSNG